MDIEDRLAGNIQRIRKSLKLTQREVGTRVSSAAPDGNGPANLISKIEKGERKVSAVELYELSVILGCEMADLMGVTEARDPLAARLKNAVEDAIESVMGGAA